MKKSISLLAVTLFTASIIPAFAAADAKKIALVKAGKITEVKASWWGFDAKDSTKALQSALNSGAKKVIVEKMKSDWIVESIKVPSNVHIIFEDGVVIRAKKGAFKGVYDALFDINTKKNVRLTGKGKVLFIMNKKDYQDPKQYKHAEWRHTVNIWNCDGVTVENITMRDSGGDGVYVGSKSCKNIVLKDLNCYNHHRQGISITGVQNLYVKNCKFNDTIGTAPECGLDLEPNYTDGVGLQNVVFEDCDFSNNNFAGVYFSNNSHLPITATFRNCLVSNNKKGGLLIGYTGKGNTEKPGKIEIVGCRLIGNKITSFSLGEHTLKNVKVILKDCIIDNRAARYNAVTLASDSEKDIHGIEISNLTVIDDKKLDPIIFLSKYGNALINPVIKNVVVKDSKGKVTKFDCEKFIKKSAPDPVAKAFKVKPPVLTKIVPAFNKGTKILNTVRFRESTEYLLYAKKGTKTTVEFTYKAVHKFNKKPVKITMYSPRIPPRVEVIEVPYEGTKKYVLDAKETGIHRFVIDAKNQTIIATANTPGQAFSCDSKFYILGCNGTLYFAVPKGVKEVQVEAGGVRREESNVAILDPEGKVVKEAKRLQNSKLLIVKRKNPDKFEIWGVKFNASKLFLRLGAPIPQMFATHPAYLLVNKGEEGKYSFNKILPKRPIVRNGDFRMVSKPRRDYVITSELFPTDWGGRNAALVTTEDHRNHIEFSSLLWQYLLLPAAGGKIKCTLTMSGSGPVTVYFSTTTGKAPHKRRPPDYGPYQVTKDAKEFSFVAEFKPRERGYIYICAGTKAKIRLSDIKMEPVEK